MARIPLLREDDETTPAPARTFLAEAAAARGRALNLHRALAHRPEVGRAFMELVRTAYRAGSTLDPRHAELVYLTATTVNNCHY